MPERRVLPADYDYSDHSPYIWGSVCQAIRFFTVEVKEHISLRVYNTFGIPAEARYFAVVTTVAALQQLLQAEQWKGYPLVILGGGSNVLLLQDVEALVVKIGLTGIEQVREDGEYVWLKVGAGEVWHDFVQHCVSRGWGGVENLSLIPGTVGAAPMQNIGAYGVEVQEVFEELEAVACSTGTITRFDREACRFGYRESVFKQEQKGRFVITSVTFRLRKHPLLHTAYGDVARVLQEMGATEPTVQQVSEAVIRIRKSKLPDPAVIGNAGSFFKNPEVSREFYNRLQQRYPAVPGYPTGNGVKVPAGWLIEQNGWKGYREGEVGVHARQALVLVNYGGATGLAIKNLSEKIQAAVKEQFGISLQPEVNFI